MAAVPTLRNDSTSNALYNPRRGVGRVLESGLVRMIMGDIPSAATTGGFSLMLMGPMRMVGAMRVTGAFGAWYLARGKVRDATPSGGVPRKMTQ